MAVLSVVAASGAAACGSPGSARPSDGTPAATPTASASRGLETLPAEEIVERARVAGHTLTTTTVTVDMPEHPQGALTGTFAQDGNGSCAATYTLAGKGSAELTRSGGTVWLKPDASYLKVFAPDAPASAAGKWVVSDTSKSRGFSTFCDMGLHLAQNIGRNTDGSLGKDLAVSGARQVDGHQAVVVSMIDEDGHPVSYVIAAEGRPYVLAMEYTAPNPMTVRLGDFNKPLTVTPPPDDQVTR
ncbi:hypothetical protein [Kitasatospora griseola]|uniref:hypothetical protein n=1 Tax=Kitasatospora griseola TaxID=2064 RepID=UPI0037F90594